jgi:27-O-demethylrifamycin SV methyltransferase
MMIEESRLEPALDLLDVGCGTGAPACRLATEHGVRVTGITTSEVGVEVGRSRARAARLVDRVTFELRDGMDNRFPDDSFDRIWVLESSHLMRQRDLLMSECARVLRPRGRLALCDIVLRRELAFDEVRQRREALALLRDVFGDARMEPLARYAEWAALNGLVVDQQLDLTEATRPTFGRWRENARRHRAKLLTLWSEAELKRFADATEVLEELWDDGTLGYGLLTATR